MIGSTGKVAEGGQDGLVAAAADLVEVVAGPVEDGAGAPAGVAGLHPANRAPPVSAPDIRAAARLVDMPARYRALRIDRKTGLADDRQATGIAGRDPRACEADGTTPANRRIWSLITRILGT
ncbi:hypothetical protein GCM10027280_10280 [Micromonospora polyrhachis]